MKKKGIHTALDTCAFVPQASLAEMLPYTDLYLVDFKHFDPEQHQKLTGQSNTLIKENLKFLAENNVKIEIRIIISSSLVLFIFRVYIIRLL